ncbi:iron ABC transporter permease [Xinfangfangia sp. CPCC 101601]|uniref:Iron ABC transporter permease n=1 Tax=Pseudogemmobacter lacusdianii TaxID=3069608 RepID=A0ABU0VZY4_9RHOB|nr:iron ABC transporter permease [Xinfangfangia sp. CPCC 101601]MDQ2066760.1 iron ABC transporter permease [Xinfangfangia sp. CPCC 101601]
MPSDPSPLPQPVAARPLWRLPLDGWSLGALLIAALVLAPVISVLWIALHPTENIWPHLMQTVLPRYLRTTVLLMLGVAVLTASIGAGAAWIVSVYEFPGRRAVSMALAFPLAIPAYVGAYALVDVLDYAGPLQSSLRSWFGWASARDYWFPQTRSLWGATLVLSAALYPYVYILARAAFAEQSGATYEVARALGQGPWGVFRRVGLPLARPAIAAGVALALMETVADYGTVHHFGVQTLTTGIFTTWLDGGNAGGAAQLSGVVLALILVLVALERVSRRGARFHAGARAHRPVERHALRGGRAALALAACLAPVMAGFVLPVAVMLWHAAAAPAQWLAPGLLKALGNTLAVAGGAAFATVAAAIFLVYGVRLAGRGLAKWVLPVTMLGYATPGAVLAVGLLFPLAALDHRLADAVLALTGFDPGLMITGTGFALGLAYMVRFFGIAQGAVDGAFGRVSPSLPLAARTLGRSAGGALRAVYMPLMRRSVLVALLVVFVDCVKELPATLLLRPFNYNTLATRVFELASLERLSEAAPAALLVMAVGLVAVAVVAKGEGR